MSAKNAWGRGLATVSDGRILDVWYPELGFGEPTEGADLELAETEDQIRAVQTRAVTTSIDVDAAPENTADAYLRLHLLSHRLVRPNEINLEGIFGVLENVAWTNLGPVAVDKLTEVQLRARAVCANLQVLGVDKFPRMVDYVVPSGVRIADGNNVRLGAHLAEGTTVMHAGFVNFNAGTLGNAMVEGRISQGVVIGVGSDIGGGASTMGTLSGGGKERVRVGERSLVGANAGIGIALGDDCIVEAGLYVTAGTKVTVLPAKGEGGEPRVVSARELSGANNILFRRNSITGAVEAVPRAGTGIELNSALHAN